MAENAQHDLDEALPALQEAVKVCMDECKSLQRMRNIHMPHTGFGGPKQKGSY